ncbi:MAG: BON domain-containing protein [Nitrosomonadales bacterium]|nr:BON domain-containing protein [Nitrosomonadales bacterium]
MRYLACLLLAAALGALQGCFPVVATGVGTGALMAGDRRTTGAFIEDESIENKAVSQISAKYKNATHINVTSFNRHVLITGEVPSEETRSEVGKIAAGVQNVKAINNELVISGTTGITSRSSDSIITADVKLRFLNNKAFQADHIKVITENGTVFLMGLVYRKEAEAATEIASTTGGVLRVVKVFEYLD